MEICSHFFALVPERGHHKVQDRAGAIGKQPYGAYVSIREDGAELREGKWELQQPGDSSGTHCKTLGTSA